MISVFGRPSRRGLADYKLPDIMADCAAAFKRLHDADFSYVVTVCWRGAHRVLLHASGNYQPSLGGKLLFLSGSRDVCRLPGKVNRVSTPVTIDTV